MSQPTCLSAGSGVATACPCLISNKWACVVSLGTYGRKSCIQQTLEGRSPFPPNPGFCSRHWTGAQSVSFGAYGLVGDTDSEQEKWIG